MKSADGMTQVKCTVVSFVLMPFMRDRRTACFLRIWLNIMPHVSLLTGADIQIGTKAYYWGIGVFFV